MKRILLILMCIFAGTVVLSAQDIITKKDGSDIRAKVLEVNDADIRYILFDEPDGPVYTLRKSEILMISYPSGRREVFNTSSPYAYSGQGPYREPVTGLAPNMKYKELKDIYNFRDYDSHYGGRWNPSLMGVCSWIVPGLGQMICGEVGRGFAWFGGSVGCCVLMGIASGLSMTSYHEDANGDVIYSSGAEAAGTALMLASSFGLLAIDICAIVDACRVAKVKNMYDNDLRRQNYSFELRPSVEYIRKPAGVQPTAGFTLAMKF